MNIFSSLCELSLITDCYLNHKPIIFIYIQFWCDYPVLFFLIFIYGSQCAFLSNFIFYIVFIEISSSRFLKMLHNCKDILLMREYVKISPSRGITYLCNCVHLLCIIWGNSICMKHIFEKGSMKNIKQKSNKNTGSMKKFWRNWNY